MEKVYRISDRIRIDVEGLVVTISPLTFAQKAEIQALAASGDFMKAMQSARIAVKYAVKGVEGLEYPDGTAFNIELSEGSLSDETVDELFNVPQSEKLAFACMNLLGSIPKDFIDPHTGEKMKGVKIVKESPGKKK